MPTLDWLNREDAFRLAARVPTRVLRPHEACSEGLRFGDGSDNLERSQWLSMMLPRLDRAQCRALGVCDAVQAGS